MVFLSDEELLHVDTHHAVDVRLRYAFFAQFREDVFADEKDVVRPLRCVAVAVHRLPKVDIKGRIVRKHQLPRIALSDEFHNHVNSVCCRIDRLAPEAIHPQVNAFIEKPLQIIKVVRVAAVADHNALRPRAGVQEGFQLVAPVFRPRARMRQDGRVRLGARARRCVEHDPVAGRDARHVGRAFDECRLDVRPLNAARQFADPAFREPLRVQVAVPVVLAVIEAGRDEKVDAACVGDIGDDRHIASEVDRCRVENRADAEFVQAFELRQDDSEKLLPVEPIGKRLTHECVHDHHVLVHQRGPELLHVQGTRHAVDGFAALRERRPARERKRCGGDKSRRQKASARHFSLLCYSHKKNYTRKPAVKQLLFFFVNLLFFLVILRGADGNGILFIMSRPFRKPPKVAVVYTSMRLAPRQAVNGILRYAQAFGPWDVSLHEPRSTAELPKGCRGLIICSPHLYILKDFLSLNLPKVHIGFVRPQEERRSATKNVPSVFSESKAFGIKAAEFFLAQSPRTYAYVGNAEQTDWNLNRGIAFVERLQEAGHAAHLYSPTTEPLPPKRETARLQRWLKSLPKPLAVFAVNDVRAREVLSACQEAGLCVPYEVSILGVDNDEPLCESARPQLSSIPIRAEESGYEAARLLDELMNARVRSKKSLPPLETIIPPGEVVMRESTADRCVGHPAVARALAFIELNEGKKLRATDVAKASGLSLNWLETLFKQTQGTSIIAEINRVRLKAILRLVRETNIPLKEIAEHYGFATPTSLCHLVKKATGQTMRSLRHQSTS